MIRIGSIFSGCGGGDLGALGGFSFLRRRYKQLPTQIVFAIDNDQKAVNTYNANFQHKALAMSVEEAQKSTIPDIDVLLGGFPCQSFSTVNPTKNPFDEKGRLYKEMARILDEKQPKAFIAENVKGFMVLKKGQIFKRALEEFEVRGYKLSHGLLNAADFGVPQQRQRVFIIGIRRDLAKRYEFPETTHCENALNGKREWTPLGAVIDSLSLRDKKYYFSRRAVEGMKRAKNNMKRGLNQSLDKPCLTITSHLAKVSINSRDPVLLVKPRQELYRRFTPREAARIQSFPDSFVFEGSEGDAYRQVGNAIPPILMWHITKQLVGTLQQA